MLIALKEAKIGECRQAYQPRIQIVLVEIPLSLLTLSRNAARQEGSSARHEARCQQEIRAIHTITWFTSCLFYLAAGCSELGWGHGGKGYAHVIDSCDKISWKLWPPKWLEDIVLLLGKQPTALLQSGCPGGAECSPSHCRAWQQGSSACPRSWAPTAPQAMPPGCWNEWQCWSFAHYTSQYCCSTKRYWVAVVGPCDTAMLCPREVHVDTFMPPLSIVCPTFTY